MNPKQVIHSFALSTYVIERLLSLTLIINDMKRIYKKVFKSKKPSLGLLHGPGQALISTLMTSTIDLTPSIRADGSTASAAEVTVGVNVSVQLRPSHHYIDLSLLSSRPLIMLESLG
jgi:hypothetical protein